MKNYGNPRRACLVKDRGLFRPKNLNSPPSFTADFTHPTGKGAPKGRPFLPPALLHHRSNRRNTFIVLPPPRLHPLRNRLQRSCPLRVANILHIRALWSDDAAPNGQSTSMYNPHPPRHEPSPGKQSTDNSSAIAGSKN